MPPSLREVDFAQQKTEGVKKPRPMGEVARVSATERGESNELHLKVHELTLKCHELPSA